MADDPVAVGVTLPPDTTDFVSAAVLGEQLGFDYLAVGEHVAFHGPIANSFIQLSHAAAVTSRVRLLSAVTVVPLYPAVLLAKLAAMTDVVSAGRFELGVGVGGEYPQEFDACGVPRSQRGARTDEALDILRLLWGGERVRFRGRFWSFDDICIAPVPPTQPAPRIWVAGRSKAAMRRAARIGDVWMPYLYTPGQLDAGLGRIRQWAEMAGRDPSAVHPAVHCFLAVGPDAGAARRLAMDSVSDRYRQDFTGSRARFLVAGTPADCVDQLGEFVDAGARSVIVTVACPTVDWAAMARVVADDVVPHLRPRPAGEP